MKNNLSLFTLIGILLFSISSIAQPYCSSSYPNYFNDYISNISLNTISVPSGPTGYSDFTAQNTNIALGSTYNLTARIVNFNANTTYIRAWIDWNQDFDFFDAGESYVFSNVVGPTFGTNVTVNILVPAGATLGTTRMRVSAARGFVPTPCNSGGLLFGETEDYSVTVIAAPVFWDGEADSDWDNPLNWSTNLVPTVTNPVVIPGGMPNYPIINGVLVVGQTYAPFHCMTLTVENGANISLTGWGQISIFNVTTINSGGTITANRLLAGNGGVLNINGGTFTTNVESIFSFNSSCIMSSGTFNVEGVLYFETSSSFAATGGTISCIGSASTLITNNSPNIDFNNLTIQSGSIAAVSGNSLESIYINGDFIQEPNSEFTMEEPIGGSNVSDIVVGEDLTIKGNNSGKASFIDENGSNIIIYGTTAVNSYYVENRWHFISSPVTSAVSGVFLDLYLKAFNEPTNSYTPSPGIVSTTYPLGIGQGFETFSDVGNGSPTISYIGGPLNTGNISPAVTGTDVNGGGIGDGEGWNLIGNPYPSAIDVGTDAVPVPGYTWSNIDNTIYAWNGANWSSFNRSGSGSGTNGGTNILPSMQGFFVKATTTTPSMSIPNSARLHSSQANYKSSTDNNNDNEIRLLVNGNGYSDEMVVRALEGASDLFDSKYDAYKLPGLNEVPQLFSKAGSSNLSINSLPDFNDGTIVPVFVKVGNSGIYAIETNDFNLSKIDLNVYLEDLKEQSIIILEHNTVYEFSYENSDDEYRFNLIFKNTKNDDISSSVVQIFSYDDIIRINKETGVNSHVFVYDMMGREVVRRTNNLDSELNVQVSTGTGNYIVKLVTDNYTETKKVFIK